MHILFIPSGYPTYDSPLRSMFFKEQAIAIAKNDNKVGVIYSETRRLTGVSIESLKRSYFQVTNEVEDGINTIRLHGWNILTMRNSIGINFWVKQTMYLFKTYIKCYGIPDIIHVQCGLYGGIVAKRLKDKYKIPYIITEHSSNVLNHNLNKYDRKSLVKAYNNANLIISVSNKLKTSMKEYTDNEIVVIPNIVNTESFYINSTKKDTQNEKEFNFISISFLKKNKNIDLTIRTFYKAFAQRKNIKLIIVGDGEERSNLENLVNKFALNDQVIFKGSVSRKNLPTILNECDCFVLPSNFETFGVAYIEALACGLPIIATKCGGPEDFYNEDLGYLIDVNNEEQLCCAMKNIVDNIDSFNKENISRYIKERFSESVIARNIEMCYKEVLKKDEQII